MRSISGLLDWDVAEVGPLGRAIVDVPAIANASEIRSTPMRMRGILTQDVSVCAGQF